MRLFKCCSGIFSMAALAVLLQCSDLLKPADPASAPAVSITISVNPTGSAAPLSPFMVSGSVSSTEDIDSIAINVQKPSGNLHTATVLQMLSGVTSYHFKNGDAQLIVGASDCNGTYIVNIRAFSAGQTESTSINVVCSGATDCSTAANPVLSLESLSGTSSVTPISPGVLTGSFSCTNCNSEVSFEATVKDSSGTPVTDNMVTADVAKATASYTVTVKAKSSTCNGVYTVVVTAKSGTQSKVVTKSIAVVNAFNCTMHTGDLEVSNTLVVGAQNASAGSSLDIDSFKVLTKINARARDTAVDLIVGYSDRDKMMFGSPKWASDSSFAVAEGWSGYTTTRYQVLPLNIDLGSATQIELEAELNHLKPDKAGIQLIEGKQYITVTSQGAIAVIEVLSLSNSISGTASLRVARTKAGIAPPPARFIPEVLVTSATLTVGADENAVYGSSIDLDEPKILLASAAKQAAETVDLVYVYTFATDEDVLGSPSWAHESDYAFVSGWSTYNTTRFYKVTGTAFDKITTKAELTKLWQETLAIDPSVPVATDDVVIAQTDKGALVLIRIVSHLPGDTGQIEIKVAK